MAFLHKSPGKLPAEKCDMKPDVQAKLETFRTKVESAHHCTYWQSCDQLATNVVVGLVNEIARNPKPGWVRGDFADDRQQLLATLEEVRQANDQLSKELDELSKYKAMDDTELQQGTDCVEVLVDAESAHICKIKSINVTWHEVFEAVAYQAFSGVTEIQVSGILADAFLKPQYDACVSAETLKTIRNQFVALDLLDVENQVLVSGSGGHQRSIIQPIWKLTGKGRRL